MMDDQEQCDQKSPGDEYWESRVIRPTLPNYEPTASWVEQLSSSRAESETAMANWLADAQFLDSQSSDQNMEYYGGWLFLSWGQQVDVGTTFTGLTDLLRLWYVECVRGSIDHAPLALFLKIITDRLEMFEQNCTNHIR